MFNNLQNQLSYFFKHRKQDAIVIIFACVLFVIVTTLIILQATTQPQEQVVSTPTPTPTPTQEIFPRYDASAEGRLAKKIVQRITLSPEDTSAKDNALTSVLKGYNSGVIYETPNVRVEYVQSADMFLAEIKTINIQEAKNETNIWFRTQGLSQEGICNLPVMFYLETEVVNQIQNEKRQINFSPLPNSC